MDTVGMLADQGNGRLYEVRTAAAASKLTEAELTVRAADWQPVHEILQFEAGERVEISEMETLGGSVSTGIGRGIAGLAHEPLLSGRRFQNGRRARATKLRVIDALHGIRTWESPSRSRGRGAVAFKSPRPVWMRRERSSFALF